MQLKTIFPALVWILCLGARANEGQSIPSALKSVTVYRTGAEMVHQATTRLLAGNNNLVIESISNTIDISSVQVNCPSAVTILSIAFANNFLVSQETTIRTRLLKDSAAKFQKDLEKTTVQLTTTADLLEVLKSNRELKGSQTGLSVAVLMKLMEYYKVKSAELQNDLAGQLEKQKKLVEIIARINNQIKEEENKNTKNIGQLHLQVLVAVTGNYDFTLSYITPNAYWNPSYDIRVNDIRHPLQFMYKANVVQTTGIDWKKIKLSLSTSMPGQWGNAPVMKSWFLSYINPASRNETNQSQIRFRGISSLLQGVAPGVPIVNEEVITGYGIADGEKEFYKQNTAPLYIVNGTVMNALESKKISPDAIKKKEFLRSDAATSIYGSSASGGAYIITLKDGLNDYVSMADNELNMTFDIDLPYDVPANGKEQAAVLREFVVPANYKYYAAPRLDNDAYLLADIPDWEKLNLLPGEGNIIFEGTYVGKTFIDPGSTLDTLNLTLGRDKRVVVKREKLVDYSSVRFLGSSKLQKMAWEITVKNNKKDTVRMLLKDQYPLSTLKEIEVELTDSGGAVHNTEIGSLTWALELAPGESRKLRFSYRVKYPKDRLVNLK